MWRHVAQRFAREPGVTGFDLMNEPPSYGRLDDFLLSSMYARALRAIRAGERTGHGPSHLVLIEPSVTFSSPQFGPGGKVGGFTGPPPDIGLDRNTVYAPHLYTGGFTRGPINDQAFAEVARETARGLHGAPVVLGEWGTEPARAAEGDPYFLDHQAFQDAHQFGALLWLWRESCGTPGAGREAKVWGEFDVDCHTNQIVGDDVPLIDELQRGYVRVAAGRIDAMSWSPNERTLTAHGHGGAGAGPMIAFLPPGEQPGVQSRGLRNEYLAQAPEGGWYFVATARGGPWSFVAGS
jgi:endoglycosylceramidase